MIEQSNLGQNVNSAGTSVQRMIASCAILVGAASGNRSQGIRTGPRRSSWCPGNLGHWCMESRKSHEILGTSRHIQSGTPRNSRLLCRAPRPVSRPTSTDSRTARARTDASGIHAFQQWRLSRMYRSRSSRGTRLRVDPLSALTWPRNRPQEPQVIAVAQTEGIRMPLIINEQATTRDRVVDNLTSCSIETRAESGARA